MFYWIAAIIIILGVSPAAADIYTWTDAAGVRHYSNVEARGRAMAEVAFDAQAHERRVAAEAALREVQRRTEALAAERAALLRALQPPPRRVMVIRNTVVVRTVVSRPYPAYDRYRPALRRPVRCRPHGPHPKPRPARHIPYYKRHQVAPKIR